MQNSEKNTACIGYEHLRLVHGENFGTSGMGIKNVSPHIADNDSLARETWLRESRLSNADTKKLIELGIDHTKKAWADFNISNGITWKENAHRGFVLGLCLITLKSLVKATGENWEDFVKRELKFLVQLRTGQKYMLIAKTRKAEEYCFVGLERLYWLSNAVKDNTRSDDPIGEFLIQKGIQIKEGEDFDLDDFRVKIDSACCRKKGMKKAETFNSLSTRLVKTIESILEDNARLNEIKDDILRNLIEKINLIQTERAAAAEPAE